MIFWGAEKPFRPDVAGKIRKKLLVSGPNSPFSLAVINHSQPLVSSMFTGGKSHNEPEFYEAIGSTACDEGAARGPGNAIGLAADKGDDALPLEGIPDLHGTILATGGDECSIGGPGETPDEPTVAFIHEEHFSSTGIPDLHGRIKARRGDVAIVGRPLHVTDNVVMVLIGDEMLSGDSIPDLDHGGIAGRGNARAIGRPGDTEYCAGIGGIIDEQAFSCGDIPDLGEAIAFTYCDAGAIRRPGNAVDGTDRVVVVIDEEEFPGDSIPDLGGGIEAYRGDASAVGRPGDAGDFPTMPTIDEEQFSGLSTPYLNGGVLTTGSKKFTIWRPGNAAYWTHMPAKDGERITNVDDRI